MTDPDDPRDLILSLTLAAPRTKVWRCLTEPDLLRQWFAPAPWRVGPLSVDVRPGGRFDMTMHGPDGESFASRGVYLEAVAPSRLVFTDCFAEGWVPAETPFMTAIITLGEAGGGSTAYQARVRHRTMEDREKHAAMGFEPGWSQCARQLEALAQTL